MPFNVTEKTLLEVQDSEWGITLVQGYRNRDGDFKAEFCKKKNYQTKEMEDLRPLSVYLGKSKEKAIGLAKYIIEKLGGSGIIKGTNEDNDVPW